MVSQFPCQFVAGNGKARCRHKIVEFILACLPVPNAKHISDVGENAEPQPHLVALEPVAAYLMASAVPGSCPRVSFTENGDPILPLPSTGRDKVRFPPFAGGDQVRVTHKPKMASF